MRPIVTCGPSGSGKSTLLRRLLKEHQSMFTFTISHTTREPRVGEQDGREYHFVSRETFESMIRNNEFIEHTQFSGNLYGTSKKAIDDALKTGKCFIVEVDIQGVTNLNNIRNANFDPVLIFIKPPCKSMLYERLRSRGTETMEHLELRIDEADKEIKFAESGPVKFDHILVNDDLEAAYAELVSILGIKGQADVDEKKKDHLTNGRN